MDYTVHEYGFRDDHAINRVGTNQLFLMVLGLGSILINGVGTN